jgi:hypothetical protein
VSTVYQASTVPLVRELLLKFPAFPVILANFQKLLVHLKSLKHAKTAQLDFRKTKQVKLSASRVIQGDINLHQGETYASPAQKGNSLNRLKLKYVICLMKVSLLGNPKLDKSRWQLGGEQSALWKVTPTFARERNHVLQELLKTIGFVLIVHLDIFLLQVRQNVNSVTPESIQHKKPLSVVQNVMQHEDCMQKNRQAPNAIYVTLVKFLLEKVV